MADLPAALPPTKNGTGWKGGEPVGQDVRDALRGMWKRPGSTALVISGGGVLTTYLAALRARRVDPIVVLKAD